MNGRELLGARRDALVQLLLRDRHRTPRPRIAREQNHRERVLAVPVVVERRRNVSRHRARNHDVEIVLHERLVEAEVAVADVAAAEDANRPSAMNVLLCMRRFNSCARTRNSTAVPKRLPRVTQGLKARTSTLGMRIELQDVAAAARDAEVIHEYPHSDAAVRGVEHTVGEQMPARVALPDEILDVEGNGRLVREREPRRQRQLVAVEQPVRGLAAAEHGLDPAREIRQRAIVVQPGRASSRGPATASRQPPAAGGRHAAEGDETARAPESRLDDSHTLPVRFAHPPHSLSILKRPSPSA